MFKLRYVFFPKINFYNFLGQRRSLSKNPIVELIARKRAQLVRLAEKSRAKDSRDQSSDSSDSGTTVSKHRKHICKRKRRQAVSSSSDSDNKLGESEKRKKLQRVSCDEENSFEDISSDDSSSVTIGKNPSTSSETPDSGIVLPDRPSSSKFKSKPHRNYRRHLPDSDSD